MKDNLVVAVLGAGKMGAGIISFIAEKGINVNVFDQNLDALQNLKTSTKNKANILFTDVIDKAVQNADYIFESVAESLDIKREVYNSLVPHLKSGAIVTSNTSTYSLAELSEGLPFADRMLITHFFYPADVISLVEIVRQQNTEETAVERTFEFFKELGKLPVLLKKDIRGFIANRLQAALIREALFLLEEGIADAKDIDTVVTESIGLRWALNGPFSIMDYGGLDIWKAVLNNLLPQLDASKSVPELLLDKVSRHEVGLRGGAGFFEYNSNEISELSARQKENLQRLTASKRSGIS